MRCSRKFNFQEEPRGLWLSTGQAVVRRLIIAFVALGCGCSEAPRLASKDRLVFRLVPGKYDLTRTDCPELGVSTPLTGFVPIVVQEMGRDVNLPEVTLTQALPDSAYVWAISKNSDGPPRRWAINNPKLGLEAEFIGPSVMMVGLSKDSEKNFEKARLVIPPTGSRTITYAHGASTFEADPTPISRTAASDEQLSACCKNLGSNSGLLRRCLAHARAVELAATGHATGKDVCRQVLRGVIGDCTAEEALVRLTVLHGDFLTASQRAFLEDITGRKIAVMHFPEMSGYRHPRRTNFRLCSSHAGFQFVALSNPPQRPGKGDSFNQAMGLMAAMQQAMLGPVVSFVRQEKQVSGKQIVTIDHFKVKWFQGQMEGFQRAVADHFLSLPPDEPAAQRLYSSLAYASRAHGPMSMIGEHLYNFTTVIDMRDAPDSSPRTAEAYQRNNRWYWGQMLDRHPQLFSNDNRDRIRKDKVAPRVDEHWIKRVPEHKRYLGEKLVHHHISRGPLAIAMPESAHKKYDRYLHLYALEEYRRPGAIHMIACTEIALTRAHNSLRFELVRARGKPRSVAPIGIHSSAA